MARETTNEMVWSTPSDTSATASITVRSVNDAPGGADAVISVLEDGSYTFSGEKDLGKMGGKFTHKGEATATELEASYRSELGDHGLFKLERPKLKAVAPSK